MHHYMKKWLVVALSAATITSYLSNPLTIISYHFLNLPPIIIPEITVINSPSVLPVTTVTMY